MQSSNKNVIITIAALLVAAFFMPWVKVFVSVSAWDIVFGDAGRMIDTSFRYIGFLIPASGILIIYSAAFNNENYPIPKKLLFLIPILTLVIIALAIMIKVSDGGGRMRSSDFENLLQTFGIGFWLTLVGSIVLPILPQKTSIIGGSTNSNIPTGHPFPTNPVNENFNASQPIQQPTIVRPQVNINLPKVDWKETSNTIKIFLAKYKLGLIIGVGALIAFIIIYFLFIKANPVKDAKEFAKNYCTCTDDLNKNNSATMQLFLTEFDSKKYKSRAEARSVLDILLQSNQVKFDSSLQQANTKYKEKYADYNAAGGKNVYLFEQTYNSLIGNCYSNNSDLAIVQSNVDAKIKTIIDAEPDAEKIKSDLIGNKIPGWNFDYLREFQYCNIVNVAKGSERIEYLVNLKLLGSNEIQPHDAQVNVVYIQNNDGWFLSEVKEIFITYNNIAPVNMWQRVEILQNCTYSIANDKKFWVKDGDYGQTYKGGLDGDVFNLTSSYIFIQSREENVPVDLLFTYRPKE